MSQGRDFEGVEQDGYLPFLDAVIWIATRTFKGPRDEPEWGEACDNAAKRVLQIVEGRKLSVWGWFRGQGRLRRIPHREFSGINPTLDRIDLGQYLQLIGPADDMQPGGGRFQDKLFLAGDAIDHPTWTGLRIDSRELKVMFPAKGRTSGASAYDDDAALTQMHSLIIGGSSARSAAEQLAPMVGGNSDAAKIDRLRRGYARKYRPINAR